MALALQGGIKKPPEGGFYIKDLGEPILQNPKFGGY